MTQRMLANNDAVIGRSLKEMVAVGTALTSGPPRRSVRAELLHTALTLDESGEPLFGPGMDNAGWG